MKHILVFLLALCCGTGCFARKNKTVKRLAATLVENQKREDISPDSFFHDVRCLKAEMLAEKDSTVKSIYRAAMAHLLCRNAWRSQRYDGNTKSAPDSIQEWSYAEYMRHAANLYAEAMQDIAALHDVGLAGLKPLTTRGRDDAIFGSDLLHVVWQARQQDIPYEERKGHAPTYDDLIRLYHGHGLREAALSLRLDSLAEEGGGEDGGETVLLRLRDEYADLPACAQVYLRLADVQGKTSREQYGILEEGFKRYPKSHEADELKNRMALLRQPVLSGQFHAMYYPDRDYDIPVKVKNMRSGQLMVYRLPDDFAYDSNPKAAPYSEQVRRTGTHVQTLSVAPSSVNPLETKEDTLHWHTPGFGRYALVLDGKTTEKLADGYQPEVVLAAVSSLTFMTTTLPDGKMRLMVTDAMSGEPQADVQVNLHRSGEDGFHLLRSHLTDRRGIVEFASTGRDRMYVTLERDEDKILEPHPLNGFYLSGSSQSPVRQLNLYTDRAIYRSGQTVYVGGIAHVIDHEKGTMAEADADIKLTYYATNGEELARHTLRTDAFGTLSDSILLTENVLPGQFRISAGNRSVWFRVEEYRRPTFEVRMDTPEGVSLPVDSMTFSGCAMTYSGWPVGGARVTGTYRLEDNWWYRRIIRRHETHQIDTLRTDAEGRFSITIPIDATRDQLKIGRTLCLMVDVLSPDGETQSATLRVPLCTEPLRLTGSVPVQQNRESLRPWHFDLIASNNQPIDGDIVCQLLQKGREVSRFTVKANQDTIPQPLLMLPSGHYDLVARAEVKGDTASCKASFTIFSITDKKLMGEHDLWLYAPCDTISHECPARFQIGTTLPEAWVYCMIVSEKGIERDTILHLSDEAMLMEIPYEEHFQHHLTVNLMLMHEGKCAKAATDFQYFGPDKRLRMQWDTFRDFLEPGQKEHWQLTLTRPDGTPASASVMVGMYDAALDALAKYDMAFANPTCKHANRLLIRSYERFVRNRYYSELGLQLQLFPYVGYDFAHWNEVLFMSDQMRVGGRLKTRSAKAGVYESVEMPTVLKEVAASAKASGLYDAANTALQGRIAGWDMAEDTTNDAEASSDAETLDNTEVNIRENLSELAFFYPRLRTDGKGQVGIDFTLPEGLTSWHLHGLAHTRDMMTATWQETIVAKKQLMAELHLPRFLRHGDEAALTASIRNASDRRQKGEAILEVCDADSRRVMKRMKVRFNLAQNVDTAYHISLDASMSSPLVTVQWTARSAESSDGEMRCLPVLSDMQNVTETRTYLLRGDTAMTLPLTDLFAHGNPKAVGRSLTVEHFTDPIYLALQALPSLAAPVRCDVLSVASALYGGIVSYSLSHRFPDVRKAIEAWAQSEDSTLMESPLVKNQQLADIVLNETPWLREAQEQKTSRRRIVGLMDEMQQQDCRRALLNALLDRQLPDGSFGWFPQMQGNAWLTTEVATLLVRLGRICGNMQTPEQQMLDRALGYLDKSVDEQVKAMREEKSPSLSLSQLRFLYIYIMCGKEESGNSRYLLSLLKRQADKLDREERALAAVILKKAGEESKARALMPRIHELLRHADGMHLDYPGGTFTSIDRKVQAHVHMMEAVSMVEPMEKDLLAKMSEWLIRQKRTQEWEQPVQSADAVYALLQSGLKGSSGEWRGAVNCDNQTYVLKTPHPFLGCVRERMEPVGKAVELRVEQRNTDGHVAWGTVYAQYQMPAVEVESNREGLNIRRDVSPVADGRWRMGDRVHVRYTITADRDYEYVCLRAPRPAAAEPARQLSGYRWHNGLGCYQAMHDASTEYFMDCLPRGTYVIEEDWILSRDGAFLLPPARLVCLYAPEYQSQTAGGKFHVAKH